MKNETPSTDAKLRERVKELKCLYDLSRFALEKDHDLPAILEKTLLLLPAAMQYPELSQVSIRIDEHTYVTPHFDSVKSSIGSTVELGKRKYGIIRIGYTLPKKAPKTQRSFLPEERNLLKMVAHELSLYCSRAEVEDEKQKLRMQLEHAERLSFVGELSAGIAHELNEPLGKILGFAQLISKAGRLNGQQQEDIERIVKASLYTREIIKKLMIFSRQMPQQIVPVDLNTIVTNVLYFMDVRFQGRGIQIIPQLDPLLPQIHADAVQMTQVLVNLVVNSIHSISGSGEVLVITRKRASSVLLVVKDTGSGMTAEVRKRIFEPFFTTKPVGQGTGLGLSVVLGIIEAHQGSVSVKSDPGKGTTFEIRLPVKHITA